MVAGIDIGSSQHWVCGPPQEGGKANVRVFGTTTDQLKELADWLVGQRVESVAMESTYVYWIPVYELLQSRGLEVVLVNARQLHNVPGRKTDFSDCQWIQVLKWPMPTQGAHKHSQHVHLALGVVRFQPDDEARGIVEKSANSHRQVLAADRNRRAITDIAVPKRPRPLRFPAQPGLRPLAIAHRNAVQSLVSEKPPYCRR
jgi:hypothetical protein